MTYRGVVKNGVVVFSGRKPKEGTTVTITKARSDRRKKAAASDPKTFADKLAPFVGMASGLPSDMSKNHDHYLYGAPKQKE